MNDYYPRELIRHVVASTGLDEATASRVVADVAAYYSETLADFVRKRHAQLQRKNLKNDDIWPLIGAELRTRRFPAEEPTERQLRRIVYG